VSIIFCMSIEPSKFTHGQNKPILQRKQPEAYRLCRPDIPTSLLPTLHAKQGLGNGSVSVRLSLSVCPSQFYTHSCGTVSKTWFIGMCRVTSCLFYSAARCVKESKGKVFPYSLPSVGPGADPGVQAVSQQVSWSESRHRPGSRLPLLSARPSVTSVAFTRWCYL